MEMRFYKRVRIVTGFFVGLIKLKMNSFGLRALSNIMSISYLN